MGECRQSARFKPTLALTALAALAGCGDGTRTGLDGPAAPRATPAAARPPAAATTPDAATFEAPKTSVRLEEVLYRPASGGAPFVEMANVGTEPVRLSALTLMVDSAALPLEAAGEELVAGAYLVVVLDGPQRVDGSTWHAGETVGISADAGRVAILDKFGQTVDEVAWGDTPGAVSPYAGGIEAAVASGGSIGRAPGAARLRSALAWVGYPAAEVTPGKANPLVPVRSTHPLSGAKTSRSGAALSWFPVPGVTGYQVQVATDESFAKIVLDQSVGEPRLDVSELPAGRYAWRVRSKLADGRAAAYSTISIVSLADAPDADRRASAGTSLRLLAAVGLAPSYGDTSIAEGEVVVAEFPALNAMRFFHALLAQAPAGPARNVFTCPQSTAALLQEPCVVLGVPLIRQHKDTQMLLLEHPVDSGAPHPWDADHGDLDENDPADNRNCVLASLAMMNRSGPARGDLSQDRIGYEVRNATSRGPEYDLNYGAGLSFEQVETAYRFALGRVPVRMAPGRIETLWTSLKRQIDQGRPMLAARPGHAFVIVGYRVRGGDRVIIVNDPWERTPQEIDLGDAAGMAEAATWWYWQTAVNFVPRSQEATITQDGDRDGMVDFDEAERFRTDPRDPDTDADGVGDKRDVAASVFDVSYGYARHRTGRDEDRDGRAMELDPDSDAGGCRDGEEDTNGNGIYESAVLTQTETWNFKFLDDSCRALAGHLTYREKSAVWVVPDVQWAEVESQTSISVRLKPEPDQPGYYEDDGSTFHYRGSHYGLTLAENCRVIGRSWAGSSGNFTGDGAARATGQITEDGRLAVHFTAGISWDDTGGWASICGVQASGKAGDSHSADFRDECLGDPVEPGEPGHVLGQKTFRFNCHDQYWSATGTVMVP